jgi:hypothetical protein
MYAVVGFMLQIGLEFLQLTLHLIDLGKRAFYFILHVFRLR